MRINGNFHNVTAWDGIAGMRIEPQYAAVLAEFGVRNVYSKTAPSVSGRMPAWYAPRAYTLLARTSNFPFFVWAIKNHKLEELDAILRLSPDPYVYTKMMLKAWVDLYPQFASDDDREAICEASDEDT